MPTRPPNACDSELNTGRGRASDRASARDVGARVLAVCFSNPGRGARCQGQADAFGRGNANGQRDERKCGPPAATQGGSEREHHCVRRACDCLRGLSIS